MFGKKQAEIETEPQARFIATLKLPRYFPKEEILGKAVFDNQLERIGQATDWTYTPSGNISLIVSGKILKEMLKEGDSLIVPFEDIERVGDFILLSKPIDALIQKEAIMGKGEMLEKIAREEAQEEKFPKAAEKNGKKKKKDDKGLKSVNELEKEFIDNILPEVFDVEKKPPNRKIDAYPL
jgi:sporulation protein YlmC with PRC-barrel domain